MKVVILAGGFGTRISEESHLRPKPMIEIGGMPILWHVMKLYSHYGYNDFIICCGYKQHVIKEYFADYYLHRSDVTFDFTRDNEMTVHSNIAEPWRVTLVDTGLNTMTGGRVKRIQQYVGDEPFFLTYGDGVADVDIAATLKLHRSAKRLITVSAVHPSARFGEMVMKGDQIVKFDEKPVKSVKYINGGYMVVDRRFVKKYLTTDKDLFFEQAPMQQSAANGDMTVYKHEGFWQCMDTGREYELLNRLWKDGAAPWTRSWK